jgi:hypothetical protein
LQRVDRESCALARLGQKRRQRLSCESSHGAEHGLILTRKTQLASARLPVAEPTQRLPHEIHLAVDPGATDTHAEVQA